MHHTTENAFQDWWWKFDRYEIEAGYIKPAVGSALARYAPWSLYKSPHGKDPIQRPYHSLLGLVGQKAELDHDSETAILDWCSEYGLLGVLLHRSESVSLPMLESGEQLGLNRYARETAGWIAAKTLDRDPAHAGAWVRQVGRFWSEFEPLDETWGRFFPQLSDPRAIPPPFSDAFWNTYAEPLDSFLEAAQFLKRAVGQLSAIRDSREKLEDKQRNFAGGAQQLIHSLTITVRPMMYLTTRNRYGFAWATGSLLSSLAMMALLDFTENRLLMCRNPKCGALFTTKSVEAKYCSARCRGAVQMRKYRSRKEKEGAK